MGSVFYGYQKSRSRYFCSLILSVGRYLLGEYSRFTAAYPVQPSTMLSAARIYIVVSLDIGNYCTIRASPACQRQYFRFLSTLRLK